MQILIRNLKFKYLASKINKSKLKQIGHSNEETQFPGTHLIGARKCKYRKVKMLFKNYLFRKTVFLILPEGKIFFRKK